MRCKFYYDELYRLTADLESTEDCKEIETIQDAIKHIELVIWNLEQKEIRIN